MLRALLLVLFCATAAPAQDPALMQRLKQQVQSGNFAAAVDTARGIDDRNARLGILREITHAHAQKADEETWRPTFDALFAETSKVEDKNERMMRLASLAWFHERTLLDRYCTGKGIAHWQTEPVFEAAAKLLPETDPAAVTALINRSNSRADRIYSKMVWAMVRSRSDTVDSSELGLELTRISIDIDRVESPGSQAYLFTELALMQLWRGDKASASSDLYNAADAAKLIESLEARLLRFKAIAASHAARNSISGVREAAVQLLADLKQLPAKFVHHQMTWLLDIARFQSKVGLTTEIIETLDRCEKAAAAIAAARGAELVAGVKEQIATLRLTNGDADGYLRYAKAIHGTPQNLREHLDERVRWLLGLRSKDIGDLTSGLLGRKPNKLDFLMAINLLPAIEIDHEPFKPGAKQPRLLKITDQATFDHDQLCRTIVEKAVEKGELTAAWIVARRIVSARGMGTALIALAKAQVDRRKYEEAVRTLDDAVVCFDTDKSDMVSVRGSKAASMAVSYHVAGAHGKALAVLKRVHPLVDGKSLLDWQLQVAVRLAVAYHEIDEERLAWQFVEKLVVLSKKAPKPRVALASAAATLKALDYPEAAAQLQKAAAQPPR